MKFNGFNLIYAACRADNCVSRDPSHRQRTSTLTTLATVIEVKENDGFEILRICSARYESGPQNDKAIFFFSTRFSDGSIKYFRCILTSSCSRWEFHSWNEVDRNEAYSMIPEITLFIQK